MSNTVNNNSEDINEIDMLKFIKNCLESVTINESHKRITEYLYNFFVRQKENCEKQIGKVPKKQMSCFPISCMIELEGEYQRSSGTYEFKWRDKRGGRHSISATTLEKLREKELDVLRDVLDGVRADKNNLTINDLYNSWIQLKRGLKDNTFANYKYMYSMFVEPDFGKNRLVDLKRSDVRGFYNYLADERNVQVNTIDSIHTVLHQVLELGVEDDYLRYNPSDNALKELKKARNFQTEKRRALPIQR